MYGVWSPLVVLGPQFSGSIRSVLHGSWWPGTWCPQVINNQQDIDCESGRFWSYLRLNLYKLRCQCRGMMHISDILFLFSEKKNQSSRQEKAELSSLQLLGLMYHAYGTLLHIYHCWPRRMWPQNDIWETELISLMILCSKFKFSGKIVRSESSHLIVTNFCIWHDSFAVVSCAKIL